MRVTSFVLALVVLLAGCNQQPQRQPKMSDAQISRLHRELPGLTDECLDKIKWDGIQAMPAETDKCFKMLPASRWRGLWRRDLETSVFCPAPEKECPSGRATYPLLLEFRRGSEPPGIGADTPLGGLYAVDFIGRRTAHGGIYGDGAGAQALVVDRLISISEIEAPRKE